MLRLNQIELVLFQFYSPNFIKFDMNLFSGVSLLMFSIGMCGT